jgi:hypothetical protein
MFIIALIFVHLVVSGAVLKFAGYKKGQVLPTEKEYKGRDRDNWELVHSKAEKNERDKWDVIATFCWAWPLEVLIAFVFHAVKGGVWGVKHTYGSAQDKGKVQAIKKEELTAIKISTQLAIEGTKPAVLSPEELWKAQVRKREQEGLTAKGLKFEKALKPDEILPAAEW